MKPTSERPISRWKTAAAICLCGLALGVTLGMGRRSPFDQTGPCRYLGQTPPGSVPQVFAPGIVSTDAHEFAGSFTPDGMEFYFTRRESQQSPTLIMVTKCVDGVWTEPEPAPFNDASGAGPGGMSFEPMVTPDGRRLYFSSDRPPPGQAGPGGVPMLNIWYVEREGDRWSAPKDPGPPFNPMKSMYVSMTNAGTIYTTGLADGMGREHLSVAVPSSGGYERLEKLGAPINTETGNLYPYVAPDESYLIFARRAASPGAGTRLFISSRNSDSSWGEPRGIDLGLPSAGTPFISPDGEYLFFSAGERGRSDIYWVDASSFLPADGR